MLKVQSASSFKVAYLFHWFLKIRLPLPIPCEGWDQTLRSCHLRVCFSAGDWCWNARLEEKRERGWWSCVPCVYPPQVEGANQKPDSTGPPYKVKGVGKCFCLLPAKAFSLEQRSTLLAQLLLSSWEVKTMGGGKLSVSVLQSPRGWVKGRSFWTHSKDCVIFIVWVLSFGLMCSISSNGLIFHHKVWLCFQTQSVFNKPKPEGCLGGSVS